ncbi:uncharacterized protein A1O9_12370 [Exophiala aquamarina CBS 119918]|uniref:DNA topoisomerase (ATP-hydrolyzing) n=1 Tax=Exophiala aquamarina CBS 119918 TaxID=1182545 RepID=A0A072NWN0_9EURO|nr:uncharacterized protein A1O9_12370 [Exophiala aquamarina CBS 119918]KEF51453.1 hypothetical protein A1O9_12370 [Exophiala aquamarina CBS 119918]
MSVPVVTTISTANQKVLDYIESTFNKIIQDIQGDPCKKAVIVLRRITSVRPYHDHEDYMRLKWHIEDSEVVYAFPGKNRDDAWRFACLARILSEIHSAVKQGIIVTKRDIFYHDPGLFKQQTTVDRHVDDIAHTCGVTRRDLNIAASPKGLVAGLKTGNLTDQIVIIHDCYDLTTFDHLANINWILVVEKEAIFSALLERRFHRHPIIGPGVLATAKGYPDLATRRFLRALVDQCQSNVPVFGLFDNDPDGIGILKCYLYGSKRSAREQSCIAPEMTWIGLKSEDLMAITGAGNSWLTLSMRDRNAATSMLNSGEWKDEEGQLLPGLRDCHAELQRMLWLNRKAEIQILDKLEGGLYAWLARTLSVALAEVQT